MVGLMQTLRTSDVPDDQIVALERYARSSAGEEMGALLLEVAQAARHGADVAVVDDDALLAPVEAARMLGMSRTHLYKVLDRGEIPSHRNGRDRKIRFRDLKAFKARRDADRRELAVRFAHQARTRSDALDEMANDL